VPYKNASAVILSGPGALFLFSLGEASIISSVEILTSLLITFWLETVAVHGMFQATSLLWQQDDVADAQSEVDASKCVRRKSGPVDGTESSVIVWLQDATSVQRQPSRENYVHYSFRYATSCVATLKHKSSIIFAVCCLYLHTL